MARLTPCIHCPHSKAGCEIKARVLDGIRGLRLSAARIRCETYRGLFRPGQRCRVRIHGWIPDSEAELIAGDWTGVIVGPSGMKRDKWVVALDDGWAEEGEIRNGRGFVSVLADRITALDEPDDPARLAELDRRENAELAELF